MPHPVTVGSGALTARAPTGALYARLMGDAWFQLPQTIRYLHSPRPMTRVRASLRVERGRHWLARCLSEVLQLPARGAAVHAELTVTADEGGERWQRTIGGRRFETWQCCVNATELAERYGCLEFRFHLRAAGERLVYVQREAAIRILTFRLRLPGCLAPHIEAYEDAASPARVNIAVTVTLPALGRLIAYDGIIDVAESSA